MSKIATCLLILLMAACAAVAQPKRQVRAVWLTTAYGLDWPQSPTGQKAQLNKILDTLSDLNVNVVMFQCRIRGDVVYRSAYEPLNRMFAGAEWHGTDPLAYVIDQCHRRGMECHAWVVCMPLGDRRKLSAMTRRSIAAAGSGLIMQRGRQLYLDPSKAGTATYLTRLVSEIVSTHDVDGVHLDYIRYPDDYRNYPSAGGMNAVQRAAARRRHITAIVRSVHDAVRQVKPWVTVSCATIGKYRSTRRADSRGWEAFDGVGQDVGRWIDEGIIDMVCPMMYFKDGDFYPFAADWVDVTGQVPVVPALGLYRIEYGQADWDVTEILRQIRFAGRIGMDGIGFYRASTLVDDTKGIASRLGNSCLAVPALPRLGDERRGCGGAGRVTVTGHVTEGRTTHLSWEFEGPSDGVTFTVYASSVYPVDTDDPRNIVETGITACHYTYDYTYDSQQRTFFAVTASDRYGNESAPAFAGRQSPVCGRPSPGELIFAPLKQHLMK